MPITRDQARQIAADYVARVSADCSLFEGEEEKAYGWVFHWNSRKYVESGRSEDFWFGNGPLLVVKDDGRVVQFGSSDSGQGLAEFEHGFRFESYDLTIHAVRDMDAALDLVERVRPTYVVPETAYGTVWRIPQDFTRQQLRDALESLPCTFRNVGFGTWRQQEFDDAVACEYELREHRPEGGGQIVLARRSLPSEADLRRASIEAARSRRRKGGLP